MDRETSTSLAYQSVLQMFHGDEDRADRYFVNMTGVSGSTRDLNDIYDYIDEEDER